MEILVKNISRKIGDEELRKLFTPFGKVKSAKIVRDAITGASKCLGLVEMLYERDAFNAINELNETTFGTRLIYVSRVLPKQFFYG